MLKDSKRIIYFLIGLTFLFIILTAMYIVKLNNSNSIPKEIKYEDSKNELRVEQNKDNLQTSLVDKNTLNVTADIFYKTKYIKCDHEIIKTEKPKEEMIGLTRREFTEYVDRELKEWKIEMFSKDEVSLTRESDALCTNHFIVGEKNGNITIFKINENGDREVYKIFKDATLSTIREENQKRLKEGIVVENEEEAIQVLEDFIS